MQGLDANRRHGLRAILGAGLLLLGHRSAAAAGELVQPAEATAQAFMVRAFAMKQAAREAGDQGYGAVVVRDGRIIAESPSRVVTAGDPSAHAEMEAIRAAARATGSRDLSGAVLYSSSRPCPMCEGAASFAGISEMIHGQDLTSAGRPRLMRC